MYNRDENKKIIEKDGNERAIIIITTNYFIETFRNFPVVSENLRISIEYSIFLIKSDVSTNERRTFETGGDLESRISFRVSREREMHVHVGGTLLAGNSSNSPFIFQLGFKVAPSAPGPFRSNDRVFFKRFATGIYHTFTRRSSLFQPGRRNRSAEPGFNRPLPRFQRVYREPVATFP